MKPQYSEHGSLNSTNKPSMKPKWSKQVTAKNTTPKLKGKKITKRKKKDTVSKTILSDPITRLSLSCPICLDSIRNDSLVSTKCGHIFCEDCLRKSLKHNGSCPTCRSKLSRSNGYHHLYIDINLTEQF